jgi:hypothetical protein
VPWEKAEIEKVESRNFPVPRFFISRFPDFRSAISRFLISGFLISTMGSRLPEEFRQRAKRYAAGVIRSYVKLPRTREEVRVLGKQLLRSGTSVAAHIREASRARSD